MTSAGSLDANVVLRLLLDDVPEQHAIALELFRNGGRFAISDAALIETIFVLGRAYGLTRAEQGEAVLGLLNQFAIDGNAAVFEKSFMVYQKHPKLSFEDCYLVTCAQSTGNAPLWTFDKKLANQTEARLLSTSTVSMGTLDQA